MWKATRPIVKKTNVSRYLRTQGAGRGEVG